MLFYKTVEIRKIPTRDKFYGIVNIKTFFPIYSGSSQNQLSFESTADS